MTTRLQELQEEIVNAAMAQDEILAERASGSRCFGIEAGGACELDFRVSMTDEEVTALLAEVDHA